MYQQFIHWEQVFEAAQAEFRLGDYSIHGTGHWLRVERNAVELARENGADEDVVRLFAFLHDCRRWNENHDPEHGRRAAEFVREIRGRLFELEDDRVALLREAIRFHADGTVTSNATMGTCWDADRLDLDRVGIMPAARFMSTAAGKKAARERFPGE